MAGLLTAIAAGGLAGLGKGMADQATAEQQMAGLALREQRLAELNHKLRLDEIGAQNTGHLDAIGAQNAGRIEEQKLQNSGRLAEIGAQNAGRIEEQKLQNEGQLSVAKLRDGSDDGLTPTDRFDYRIAKETNTRMGITDWGAAYLSALENNPKVANRILGDQGGEVMQSLDAIAERRADEEARKNPDLSPTWGPTKFEEFKKRRKEEILAEMIPGSNGPPSSQGPAGTSAPKQQGPASDVLARARDAIARGAPRDAVIKRLKDAGIDPTGL